MTDLPDFDWKSDDSIAVCEQPAIAVYENKCGQVTLRRERSWDEEDDVFIPIAKDNVLTVIAHILRAAGMFDIELIRARDGGGSEDVQLQDLIVGGAVVEPWDELSRSVPKDKTAAERQRRYRSRQRNGNGRDVTDERNVSLPLLINGHSEEVPQTAE
jgi:hypothetical protein